MFIKKSKLIIYAIILVVITSIVSVVMVNPFGGNIIGLLKLSYATKLLDALYYEDVDIVEAGNMAIAGAAASTGDPYTGFIWGDEAEQYLEDVEGNYCGVGLYIENDIDENLISVVSPIAGSPAEEAGIATGDKILMIDGQTYTGMQISEASDYMRGEEGTDVTLTIRAAIDGTTRDVSLTRSKIVIESVSSEMLENSIGYISITQFTEDMSDNLEKQLKKLKKEGMTSLIIDLRNNPGGLLDEAIDAISLFVPENEIITYTLDKYEDRKDFYSSDCEKYTLPIAILINGGSASASEVLTGALNDYDIATVIGEKSYGKGVVQSVVPVFDGIMTVTTARYFTPNGVCIHGEGIEPDIEIELSPEKTIRLSDLPYEEDVQLQAAVSHLINK